MKRKSSPQFCVGETVEHYVSSLDGKSVKRSVARVAAVEGTSVLVVDTNTRQALKFAPRKTDGLYVAPRNRNAPGMPDYIFRISSSSETLRQRAA